jgi:hypothetical protein
MKVVWKFAIAVGLLVGGVALAQDDKKADPPKKDEVKKDEPKKAGKKDKAAKRLPRKGRGGIVGKAVNVTADSIGVEVKGRKGKAATTKTFKLTPTTEYLTEKNKPAKKDELNLEGNRVRVTAEKDTALKVRKLPPPSARKKAPPKKDAKKDTPKKDTSKKDAKKAPPVVPPAVPPATPK